MANPQPTDAHIRIAHTINEAIMLRDFSKRQRKILDLVLRLSWGCGKKTANIERRNYFEIVGIGEGHIKLELDWLVASKIIFIDGSEYTFNKDFDQWQVSRVSPFLPDKLTELVRFNLNGYKLTEMVSSIDDELTESVSKNLPKREESTYRNGKFATPELASAKERGGEGRGGTPPPIKEILKKDINIYNNNKRKTLDDDPDKYVKGKYGHMVMR